MNPVSVRLAGRDVEAAAGSRHVGTARPLSQLRAGEAGRIVRVQAGADAAASRRLFDLGFVPGAVVECVRRAPLGDPTVYRVADFEIALRKVQSASVLVAS